MKKLLSSSVLALAVCAMMAPELFAGRCFGLFPHCGCRCRRGNCCTVCVKPYNAFTPTCCGNINVTVGCCAPGGGQGPGVCYNPLPANCNPMGMEMGCEGGMDCGQVISMGPTSTPVPNAASASPQTKQPAMPYGGPVQSASYRVPQYPAYSYGYNPYGYASTTPVGQSQNGPSYWYDAVGGR